MKAGHTPKHKPINKESAAALVVKTQTARAPELKPEGQNTEYITHIAMYPHHFPEISARQRKAIEIAHTWHLKQNHVSPHKLNEMDKLPYELGLPQISKPAYYQCITVDVQSAICKKPPTKRQYNGHPTILSQQTLRNHCQGRLSGHQHILSIT